MQDRRQEGSCTMLTLARATPLAVLLQLSLLLQLRLPGASQQAPASQVGVAHATADPVPIGPPGHLRYLSYYTNDYTKYGHNMSALGGTNLGPPLIFTTTDAVNLHDTFGLPMMYTPGGPMRMDRTPPSRGSWYLCGCRMNTSLGPEQCLKPNWRQAFQEQAASLVPLIQNKTVVGIFFGDEVSCSCNVPFVAFDLAAAFFRNTLTAALNAAAGGGRSVFYTTNECFSALACVPPPGVTPTSMPGVVAGCKEAYNSTFSRNQGTPVFAGYWPHVPRALDFVSMDAYVDSPNSTSADGDGAFEPVWIRQFYNDLIYPKLASHQRVWVVPGLCGPIRDTTPPQITPSKGPYLNDSGYLAKMEVYAQWTREDERVVGWLPWHWETVLPGAGTVTPRFAYGADEVPRTLAYIKASAPPPLKVEG